MPDDHPSSLWVAVGFAWRLGYSIAIPLVVLLAVGRFLDRRLGTSPWLLITGLAISFAITNVLMFREALRVMKEAEADQNVGDVSTAAPQPPLDAKDNEKIKMQKSK